MKSLPVCTSYPSRRLFFITIILLFIPPTIFIVHQHLQTVPYTPFLYDITERNLRLAKEHVARLYQPLSSSILRGIIIFYPDDQEQAFLPELLWLYRSWIEMMKSEPPLWRTDLVVYTNSYTIHLQQLGCVYNRIRISRDEPPQCRVFRYVRVSSRDVKQTNITDDHLYQDFDENRSILLITHLSTYEYLDSINIIAECYPSFSMYDYILRTDMDVFLTKSFAQYVPYNNTLLVGLGLYSTPFNTARLRRIAKDMGWSCANIVDIGSTWYGPPRMAQRIANFSLEAMLYLSINEFTTPERERKLGILLWPEWHYGVLTLYGGHMAINHLIVSENLQIGLAYDLLDQGVTSRDQTDIELNHRLHLHCWHGGVPFSKFRFKQGKYNHIQLHKLQNDSSAAGFAMRMALESRFTSLDALKQSLLHVKNASNF